MTAAQALTQGLTGPASTGRSSKGGSGADRGGASFGDALNGASKGTADAAPSSRGRSQAKSDQGNGDTDATVTPVAQDSNGTINPPVTQAQAARDASGSRAGAGEGRDVATSLMQRLQAAVGNGDGTAESGTPDEAGPWLPGQVDDDGETFDAARLLAIMRAQGAQGVSNAGGATVVTVLGQERHLALGGLPGELAVQLADEQSTAATALRDGTNAAALSAQADPGADGVERARVKAGGEDVRLATEPGVGRGRALFAAEERGQSGSGLGEHGQDGRQQEGRNSGNNGQSSSGVFASTMQNPGLQAANTVRGGYGAAGAHDPVSDQIAERVRADLAAEGASEASSDGVVKVLNIELKPANLGAVTLRMSLKDNVITLHVETQNSETRAMIEREQAKLTSTLSAAGYTVESITAVQSDGLRASGVPAQGDPNNPSAAFQQPGSQGNGQGASEFSGEGRSGRSSPGGGEAHSQPSGKDDSAAAANRGVDGVYV